MNERARFLDALHDLRRVEYAAAIEAAARADEAARDAQTASDAAATIVQSSREKWAKMLAGEMFDPDQTSRWSLQIVVQTEQALQLHARHDALEAAAARQRNDRFEADLVRDRAASEARRAARDWRRRRDERDLDEAMDQLCRMRGRRS